MLPLKKFGLISNVRALGFFPEVFEKLLKNLILGF